MTLLGGLFGEKATTLTVRDDIITSDRMIGELSSMFGSLSLSTDYTATYEEIVRKQLWARIAVNKLAYGIGRVPLKTYTRNADGSRERVTDSPLAQLMRRPNETKETGHAAGFKARIVYDLYTFANALIVKVQPRPDQPPTQLRPVSPRGCVIDENGDYVWHRDSGNERRFKAWQVIHLIEPGPTVSGFGVSRWEAARLTLAIEYAAQRLGAATFHNGARPGGIINVKSGLGTGDARTAAIERFKSEILRRFGGVDKAGLPAVLEGDVNWMAMAHNLNDSAVVDHRQLTREEIAALLDIPQPAIGILDEANFASVDMLHIMLYQDTFGWPVTLIEETFETQLIAGVPAFQGQFVEFDMNGVMRGAFTERMSGYVSAINGMVMTPDEARDRENLPRMGGRAAELQFPLNTTAQSADQAQEV
jgi:HK97 family phage portal protein